MFTGIIEEMGRVEAFVRNRESSRLTVQAKIVLDDLVAGASVTINGACMTVLDLTPAGFSCDVSPETLRLTNLGGLSAGNQVNLERAMRLSDRLGGHMVSGHVEGIGKIAEKKMSENAIILSIDVPSHVLKYCVSKGSITLDGVSMTINGLNKEGLTISVIPHTAEMTSLGFKGEGDLLNLESDLIGRYVERLLEEGGLSYAT